MIVPKSGDDAAVTLHGRPCDKGECLKRLPIDTLDVLRQPNDASEEVSQPREAATTRVEARSVTAQVGAWADRLATEWVYLAAALVFGLVLVLLTPPFQIFDEPAHYQRAWSVAQGQVLAAPDGSVSLPVNVAGLPVAMRYLEVMQGKERYRPGLASPLIWQRISSQRQATLTAAAGYGPVGYVPQAGGILIARAIGVSPLLGLYLGRLANLLVCVTLVFFAIRLVPIGKPLVALMALFPLPLALMASLNLDGLMIAGWLFFFCLMLRLTRMQTVGTWQIAALLGAAGLVCTVKPGYGVLVLLVFALHPSQLGGRLRYGLITGGALVIALVATIALQGLGPDAAHAEAFAAALGSPPTDPTAQLSLMLHHPLGFLAVLKTTYAASAILFGRGMFGVLAWGAIAVTDIVTVAVAGGLVILLMRDEQPRLRWWHRVVLAGTALLAVLVISAAMYVYATPVGDAAIFGLQGRYYLPMLPLAVFSVYGIRLHRPRSTTLILLTLVLIELAATLSLLLRYYY
jgi:uncharacterized membrane protein